MVAPKEKLRKDEQPARISSRLRRSVRSLIDHPRFSTFSRHPDKLIHVTSLYFVPRLFIIPLTYPVSKNEKRKRHCFQQPRKRNLEIGIARRARHHPSWYRESELTPRWRRQHRKKSSQLQKGRLYCNAFATAGNLRR